jgi:hypothetical protein
MKIKNRNKKHKLIFFIIYIDTVVSTSINLNGEKYQKKLWKCVFYLSSQGMFLVSL